MDHALRCKSYHRAWFYQKFLFNAGCIKVKRSCTCHMGSYRLQTCGPTFILGVALMQVKVIRDMSAQVPVVSRPGWIHRVPAIWSLYFRQIIPEAGSARSALSCYRIEEPCRKFRKTEFLFGKFQVVNQWNPTKRILILLMMILFSMSRFFQRFDVHSARSCIVVAISTHTISAYLNSELRVSTSQTNPVMCSAHYANHSTTLSNSVPDAFTRGNTFPRSLIASTRLSIYPKSWT